MREFATILKESIIKGVSMRVILITLLLLIQTPRLWASSTIKIPLNHWGSQQVISIAVGNELSMLGYKVQYIPINSTHQSNALAKGIIHFQVELWQTANYEEYNQLIEQKQLILLDTYDINGKEDWWYPLYVKKLCPELPHWKALIKCASLFEESDTGRSTYYTGLWNYRDADLIRSLSLPFVIKRFTKEEHLWNMLEKKIASKSPIILLNWTPNWIDMKYEGEFVQFPEFSPECETDPSWGPNPNMLFDCANNNVTSVAKVMWPPFAQKHPCAYELLKRIQLTAQHISHASLIYKENNNQPDLAASLWKEHYANDIKKWHNSNCTIQL